MRSLEMFAGAGGLALGVHSANLEPLVVNEVNAHACETLRSNGEWPVLEADCRDVDWTTWAGQVDLLAAGVPCQPFSIGGLANGHDDDRNLFPEFLRALDELRPRAVIVENVQGLVRPSFRPYLDYVVSRIANPEDRPKPGQIWERHAAEMSRRHGHGTSGYRIFGPTLLQAADFGVPQYRKRLFIVAFRRDSLRGEWEWPKPTHSREALIWDQVHGGYWREHGLPETQPPKASDAAIRRAKASERPEGLLRWVTLRDALAGLPEPGHEPDPTRDGHVIPTSEPRVYRKHGPNLLDWVGKTVKAGVHGSAGGENILLTDDSSLRHLSVREVARIQTFPDGHVIRGARSRAVNQLGNAVPVRLAGILAESVRDALARR
jgi:DNA (cytosine-5)-methyltransferase 1